MPQLRFVTGCDPHITIASGSPFAQWELEWDRENITITLGKDFVGGSCQEVLVQDGTKRVTKYMLFVHQYAPDQAAVQAYEAHAKRTAPTFASEATLFFAVDDSGCAITPAVANDSNIRRGGSSSSGGGGGGGGLLHAVLPTNIETGVAAHLHASWLLSVDRQSLQSLTENAWNACCLRQYVPFSFL